MLPCFQIVDQLVFPRKSSAGNASRTAIHMTMKEIDDLVNFLGVVGKVNSSGIVLEKARFVTDVA